MSKLGQNFNAAGISFFLGILGGNKSLALPHLTVPNIRSVNWAALKEAGFKVIAHMHAHT
jgi:phosphatidylglycerophosphatase GEP4